MGRGNGCTEYVRGTVKIHVAMPANHQACRHCELCKREEGFRYRCMATGFLVYDLDGIRDGCPIVWEENNG